MSIDRSAMRVRLVEAIFQGWSDIDKSRKILKNDEEYDSAEKSGWKLLRNQESEFLKAFSYWPIPTAREGNNIYDVRSYELKPGSMYDWGNYWSKGINCRKNVRDDIPYVCLFPKYLILATYLSTSILIQI